MTTHDERVRQSFRKQAFMSTLGAELMEVGEGTLEIRLPFSPSLTQQDGYLHTVAHYEYRLPGGLLRLI